MSVDFQGVTADLAEVDEIPDYLGDGTRVKEDRAEFNPRRFDTAILETDCPECGRHVGALIKDGPDPVFADVTCPRDVCGHEWSERVA